MQISLGGKHGNNRYALVDDIDYEQISSYWWTCRKYSHTYYACRWYRDKQNNRKLIFLHTQLLGVLNVDHINGDGLDNRRQNLRACTHQENCRNQRKPKNNTSGYKGVSWHKTRRKWKSSICINGVDKHLGWFDSAEDAANAYDNTARIHFGEFAKMNFT